jgi:hypothetical protein
MRFCTPKIVFWNVKAVQPSGPSTLKTEEDKSSTLHRNCGNELPDYTASQIFSHHRENIKFYTLTSYTNQERSAILREHLKWI